MLPSVWQQIWKTQQWLQDWKRSVSIPIPKKGNAKECSNYHTNALISHASKVMLKILQARLQQYLNQELADVQAGFRKSRGTTDQIANICWIIENYKRIPETHLLLFHWLKPLTLWITTNWKILEEMGIPDYLTSLLRNLYVGQEATVKTGHRTTDWFIIGRGIWQSFILSPCLFILHAEHIMQNVGLHDSKWNQDFQEKYQQSQIMQMITL